MNADIVQAFGNDILLPLIVGVVAVVYLITRSKSKDQENKEEKKKED